MIVFKDGSTYCRKVGRKKYVSYGYVISFHLPAPSIEVLSLNVQNLPNVAAYIKEPYAHRSSIA